MSRFRHGHGTVVLDSTQGKIFLSEKVESFSSHGSDMAKERLSLTIYKVVLSRRKGGVQFYLCKSRFRHGHGQGMVAIDSTQSFFVMKRWSPVLVTVQTWPRNGCP